MKGIITCDPGSKGSYCLLLPDENTEITFMNTTLPFTELIQTLKDWRRFTKHDVVYIEKVHAIGGSGAKATFNFGWNAARVNLAAEAAGFRVEHKTR